MRLGVVLTDDQLHAFHADADQNGDGVITLGMYQLLGFGEGAAAPSNRTPRAHIVQIQHVVLTTIFYFLRPRNDPLPLSMYRQANSRAPSEIERVSVWTAAAAVASTVG